MQEFCIPFYRVIFLCGTLSEKKIEAGIGFTGSGREIEKFHRNLKYS